MLLAVLGSSTVRTEISVHEAKVHELKMKLLFCAVCLCPDGCVGACVRSGYSRACSQQREPMELRSGIFQGRGEVIRGLSGGEAMPPFSAGALTVSRIRLLHDCFNFAFLRIPDSTVNTIRFGQTDNFGFNRFHNSISTVWQSRICPSCNSIFEILQSRLTVSTIQFGKIDSLGFDFTDLTVSNSTVSRLIQWRNFLSSVRSYVSHLCCLFGLRSRSPYLTRSAGHLFTGRRG